MCFFTPSMGKFLEHDHACQNRPLLDDAVFLKGWHRSGNGEFRQIAMETEETLLRDENPPETG